MRNFSAGFYNATTTTGGNPWRMKKGAAFAAPFASHS
jgi:hypothetical protein